MLDNITPIFLPSGAPELENVRQYLRQSWLSNTVFENYDDAACAAWAQTHRPTRNHQIHQNARLDSRRSAAMTFDNRRREGKISSMA